MITNYGIKMKKLGHEISRKGYHYTLMHRDDILVTADSGEVTRSGVAMYGMYRDIDDAFVGYEVFEIKVQKARRVHFGDDIVEMDNKEMFPSDEDFGVTAWYFMKDNLDYANRRYEEVRDKLRAKTAV